MTEDRRFNESSFREIYQPHWLWFIACILIPLALIVISLVGVEVGSMIPFGLAAAGPKVALVLSTAGMFAALVRGRRVPLGIAAIGVILSLLAYLSLWWLDS